MATDGSLHVVPATDGMSPVNPSRTSTATPVKRGDLVFQGDEGTLAFYRPSDGRVHRAALPRQVRSLSWDNVFSTGQACTIRRLHHGGPKMLVAWSARQPSSVRITRLRSVLEASDPVGIVLCAARPGQVVLFPGDDRAGISAVVTWNHRSAPLVARYHIDSRFDPWLEWTLADGRALFVAHGGIFIATDRTNTGFVFRHAPTIKGEEIDVDVVGNDLVAPPYRFRGQRVPLSTDHGRSWRSLDLRGSSWQRGR
ncbi:MAG TPA: hypothetical protein VFR99_01215 [Marmoricola sp.]|nr:hypothetical protein [Marmoricola sp.]